jgi:hypothetical protein
MITVCDDAEDISVNRTELAEELTPANEELLTDEERLLADDDLLLLDDERELEERDEDRLLLLELGKISPHGECSVHRAKDA